MRKNIKNKQTKPTWYKIIARWQGKADHDVAEKDKFSLQTFVLCFCYDYIILIMAN